ncbi:hypothetical protein ANN_27787 [Periplaneta americana]|uniref:DDE Tnp4 domain-containing protein n=1 Tax=Periplaneta americana TaxID=6978 RepID=A0ABQ8RV56_PERAM|nr:hypothetical protein ANN_27787 [Periplaneta americana]
MYSDNEIQAAACLSVALIIKLRRKRRNRKPKRCWTKEWIKNRERHGITNNLLRELREGDESFYKNFLRMSAADFDNLLEKVAPLIERKDTLMRRAIPPAERLVVTLRYLATGDSYKSLMYLFRITANTISQIIPEVCRAIYDVPKKEHLKAEWTEVAVEFEKKWNFPNCIGAIDGTHANVEAPANGGSLYFNYKHTHSIILMALVDANYRFTYINVGAPGRDSDGGVYQNCSLSSALENNTVNIPRAKPLPGRNKPVSYVVVAEDAFALKSYIMKPFANRNQSVSERIFNYRLSRARRIVENAFGLISARFRCLRKTIELSPKTVERIVCAAWVLHNFLTSQTQSASLYAPRGTFDVENQDCTIIPGSWRNEDATMVPMDRNVVITILAFWQKQ